MGEVDDLIAEVSPYYKARKKKADAGGDILVPSREYRLLYNSSAETLEPVYFWILDYLDYNGFKAEKLVDNFASSSGGGHFGELMQRASQMQQEASRVLGTVNNILKGVLNLIYDLKEFKIRLSHYEAAKSSDKNKKEAGLLALKQIWMDKVDIQRGQGSLNALTSGNLQFVTLRDAFMSVNTVDEVEKLDLNERVKRILKPRVQEFFEWQKRSEQELKKRYEIEKIYLKSQVEALRLNARWAKPYLRAAEQLSQNEKLMAKPGLVTAFNTIFLELSLFAISKVNVVQAVNDKDLPQDFRHMRNLRTYYNVMTVEFMFRGIPNKVGQHYTFGGRVDVSFKAYSLNQDEIDLLKEKMKNSDLQSALKIVQGMTDDSLKQIQIDIDEILNDEKSKEEKEQEVLNPFVALFSLLKLTKSDPKKLEKERMDKLLKKGPKKENFAEKYIRNYSEAKSMDFCFTIYDHYKKQHGMTAFPYDIPHVDVKPPVTKGEVFFRLKKG